MDDCRKIESARCSAGVECGVVDDASRCERFYRDHCLHGLAVAEAPGAPAVASCVAAIEAAAACGPDAALDECDAVRPTEGSELAAPCDVVLHPEWTEQCAFLVAGNEGGAGGSGGSGGGGGSNP